jgi:hypothetical protein
MTAHQLRAPRSFGIEHVQVTLVTVGVAALAGYALEGGHRSLAIALCFVPLVAWLVARPLAPLLALGAAIPITHSLTGGRGGFNLAISDVLLVLIGGALVVQSLTARAVPAVRALRPIAPVLVQYGAVMIALLPFHLGVVDLAKSAQRFELFVLPLIVGAYAAIHGRHVRVLQAYVLATSAIALVWPVHSFGMQKNPTGQLIANAILLLIGMRSLRRFLPLLVVLIPGLFLTGSRGAILAAVVGVAVILAVQGLRPRVVLTRVVPLLGAAIVAFVFLPLGLQQRLTTYSAGVNTPAQYALHIRQQYSADAKRLIRAHPWVGVGVGNYLAGDFYRGTLAEDPHDVLLLQAAEGGYLLAISFVILTAGVALAVFRMRELEIAAAVAGVFVATFVHGLFDIYWVRGTPVLAWLLVGMVCGCAYRVHHEEPAA